MGVSLGDITAVLRLDISQFNANLNTASASIRGLGSSSEMSGIRNLSKTFTDVGTSLTKSVTLPLLALGAGAVKVTSDFDSSMSKVQALSGATSDEMVGLTKVAREMGASTVYSAKESADALGFMALAGWDTTEMTAGLEPILKLAGASGMELAKASDIVTDSLTMFGMSANEATRLTDVMAYTQSHANTNVEQLGEALVYCGASAHAMGYDAEQTSAILGKLADSGLKGSVAGTTLNSMFKDMKKKAENGAIAIGKTKVAIEDSNGNYRSMIDILADVETATEGMTQAEKDRAISAIWQVEAQKGVNAIMGQGVDSVRQLDTALRDCNGTANKQYEIMQNNLKGSLANLSSAFEDLGITVGNIIIPVLKQFVDKLITVVDKVNKFAQAHPKIASFAVAFGAVAMSIGPLLLMIGKAGTAFTKMYDGAVMVKNGFGLLRTGFLLFKTLLLDTLIPAITGVVMPALQALWGLMVANPIGVIIVAITALVAGFIYLWNNVDGFKEFWINAWNTISTACGKAWDSVVKWCQDSCNSIGQWFSQLPSTIGNYLSTLLTNIGTWGAGVWNSFISTCTNVVTTVQTFFSELPYKIGYALGVILANIYLWAVNTKKSFLETCTNVITTVATFFSELPYKIGFALGVILANIYAWAVNTKNSFIETCTNVVNTVTTFFNELPGRIWNFLTACIKKVEDWTTQTVQKTQELGTQVVQNITTFFSQLPGKISNFINICIERVTNWTTQTIQKAKELGTQVVQNITTYFSQLPGKILAYITACVTHAQNWVTQTVQKAKEMGTQVLQSITTYFSQLPGKIGTYLSQGITKMTTFASELASKGRQAGTQTISNIKSAFTSLPSTLSNIGRNAINGLWNGMQSVMSNVKSKVKSFCDGLVAGFKSVLKIKSPSRVFRDEVGKNIGLGVAKGIDNSTSDAENSATSLATGVVSATASKLKNAKGIISSANKVFGGLNGASLLKSDSQTINGSIVNPTSLTGDNSTNTQTYNNSTGVSIYLNIDKFLNNTSSDVKGLMTEMADVIKSKNLVTTGSRG